MTTGILKIGENCAVSVSSHPGFDRRLVNLYLHLGTTLLKNLKNALSWSKTQRKVADSASSSLSKETLAAWTKVRQEFDWDPSSPNPYEEPEACTFPGPSFMRPHTHLQE